MNPRSLLAGDRVVVIATDVALPVASARSHRKPAVTEYVVRTDPTDGGMAEVVNVRIQMCEATS
jgi:threonine dehydrogenase-like Zn-dependent dehydrogenase